MDEYRCQALLHLENNDALYFCKIKTDFGFSFYSQNCLEKCIMQQTTQQRQTLNALSVPAGTRYGFITNHTSRLVCGNDPEIKRLPQSMYYM